MLPRVYAKFLLGLPENERTAFRIILDPLSATPLEFVLLNNTIVWYANTL